MSVERRRAFFSGRVQGVGFRFTAQRLAEGLGVVGTVKNLPDGRVELVAEGPAERLDSLFAAIRSEMGAKARSVDVESETPSPTEFRDFSILY